MDIDNIMDYGFNIALNMYRNLTGDYDTVFDTTEDIYTEIDKNFDSGDGLVNVESLDVNITDNGTYTYEKTLEIDGYNPVRVNVELNTETYYQNGYNDGYGVGEGVGYRNGVTAGKDEQKGLLEETVFKDNGVYEKEDGWKRVSVEVDIPTFDTETLSVELTDNGNYSYTPTKDGYDSVSVSVNVPTGGGGIDLTQIGWSVDENNQVDNLFKSYIEYSKSVISKIDGKISLLNVFSRDKMLTFAPKADTSNATTMKQMFYNSAVMYVPLYNTPKVTNMEGMFSGCGGLKEVPLFDTSNVTTMYNMFNGCTSLKEVPLFDTSNVTNMYGLFDGCVGLKEIPPFDTSNVTTMYSMLYDCTSLTKVPTLDCGNVVNCSYLFGAATNSKLTTLGGFKDIGKQSSLTNNFSSYFLSSFPNLTYESIMNVINNLYDRKTAGYSNITLKFGTTNMNKLTDEEKAIATNKGWTLTT